MIEGLYGAFIIPLIIATGDTPSTRSAANAAALASYKQTGLEKQVDNYTKKYIPEIILKHGWFITLSYQAMNDKKIEYSWTF